MSIADVGASNAYESKGRKIFFCWSIIFLFLAALNPLSATTTGFDGSSHLCDELSELPSPEGGLELIVEGDGSCFSTWLPSAGLWWVETSSSLRSLTTSRLEILEPAALESCGPPAKSRVLRRSIGAALVEVRSPGLQAFCVKAGDPLQPRGAVRLQSHFEVRPTKGDPDEDEPDPDPFAANGCQRLTHKDGGDPDEDEPDPDPFAANGCQRLTHKDGGDPDEDEPDPDPFAANGCQRLTHKDGGDPDEDEPDPDPFAANGCQRLAHKDGGDPDEDEPDPDPFAANGCQRLTHKDGGDPDEDEPDPDPFATNGCQRLAHKDGGDPDEDEPDPDPFMDGFCRNLERAGIASATFCAPPLLADQPARSQGSETFRLVLDHFASVMIRSEGNSDVTAELFDRRGHSLAHDEDSGSGRNFHLAVPMAPGVYVLRLESDDNATYEVSWSTLEGR